MSNISRFYILIVTTFFVSCGVQGDLYRDKSVTTTPLKIKAQSYRSIYSIANAGAYQKGPNEPLMIAMGNYLSANSKEDDYLLFLGDNVHGNDLEKDINKRQLQIQLETSQKFKGTPLFLQGELDWNEGGVDGLEDLETYIEDFYKEEDHFLPKNGCPIETIDVSDDIELILINSQWYIEDWSKIKGLNDKCQLKTRLQFENLLSSEIRKAAHKTVIIGMHHPLYTNGVYGGEIPIDVMYKPSQENGFIPFGGFLWSFLRSQGGLSKQDRFNPIMNDLMNIVELASNQAERVIVLSGHERTLQHIDHENIQQVVAGTGSSIKSVRLGKRGQFSSTKAGFSEVRIYDDNSSTIHFFTLNDDGTFSELYNNKLFELEEMYDMSTLPTSYPKTQKASIYPAEDIQVDAKYEKFWGKHYRYVYGTEVEAPIALLDTLYGGLKVERAGGGNQTLSLRLVTKDDKEYNMRAIAKDPIAFLKSSGYNDLDEEYFDNTVPATIIEDFYTAAHPYGAFAIPRLAGAIEVNHTHPILYYVPKQKALGNFNETHGDKLYMIVEKPDGDFSNSHMFSNSEEVESTPDLFEELRDDENRRLDERSYIRARIFDMLIGDWDRHEDQWRWSEKEKDSANIDITEYIAVPRDRDQVFANFDGRFIEKLQKVMSGTRSFGKYGPDIEFIAEFSESAINLDRALVARSSKEVWLEEVAYIQKHLTPEIVSKAFKEAPIEVQDDVWMGIQEDLLSRKRNLKDIVLRYYEYFASFQVLKGTDKDDYFVINNLKNGAVQVQGFRIKDGEKGAVLFDRTYTPDETQEIWIYGLDDTDTFEVNGTEKSAIKVVIAGGLEEDTYTVEGGRNVKIFDQKSYKNTIHSKGKASFHIDDIYENHVYDSERRPDGGMGFGLDISYDPDNGVTPQIQLSKKKMGFERNPFTTMTEISAQYFSLTQAADFNMAWHRSHLFHDWNFKASGRVTTANYTENFFGVGNESTNNFGSFDANRIPLQIIKGGIGTYYDGEYGTSTSLDVFYERFDIDNAPQNNNLLTDSEYATARGIYQYHSVDDERFTTRGMHFKLVGSFSDEVNSTKSVAQFDPSITFWNAIDRSRDLVFKTQINAQLRLGDDIPFYKLAQLGAANGLRSYRFGRFQGQQALSGSIDFAYKFKPLRTSFFPLRIQGFVGYDTGRVWISEEQSNTLHYSYGGGIKLTTASVLKANVQYFTGPEGGRLGFGLSVGL
ncbi:hypothetical protein EAX61_08235 [Dokdonia sinensis]|uniref:Phosphoesterase n=1 Tax=Dokdonia sinensis TaxID=2479847 RepID=A0A3M0GQM2_9FLAO|nr:hypothetical protein EAX61_08235 [Dokdonia sinensis]